MSEHNEAPRRGNSMGVDQKAYRTGGGFQNRGYFCGVAHPENPPADTEEDYEFVFCRRLPHHDGSDHAAFRFSISVPETWPDTRYVELEEQNSYDPPF